MSRRILILISAAILLYWCAFVYATHLAEAERDRDAINKKMRSTEKLALECEQETLQRDLSNTKVYAPVPLQWGEIRTTLGNMGHLG